MLKRFLVFRYDAWDDGGGWMDFGDSFDFLDEAIAMGKGLKEYWDNVDIVDTLVDPITVYYLDETGKLIKE